VKRKHIIILIVLIAVSLLMVTAIIVRNVEYMPSLGPSLLHLLGTNELGRDIFLELFLGAVLSVASAAIASIFGAIIGILMGILSAISNQWIFRRVLISLREAAWSISGFFLALMISLILGGGELIVIIVLIFFQWPVYAEIIDWNIRSVMKEAYIKSQRALGANFFWIFRKTLLPQAIMVTASMFPARWAEAWTVELSLNFLGLGFQPDNPSLGRSLFHAVERNIANGTEDISILIMVTLIGIFLGINLKKEVKREP
jgi:peptide/nickel transport system permease protein